jgi:predicted enzyme related to lactoylglutathione lyase
MKRQDLQGITNYFDVKSVQEYSAKVKKLGGKVISPKTLGPRYGLYCYMRRYRDNTFGIFEADQTAK